MIRVLQSHLLAVPFLVQLLGAPTGVVGHAPTLPQEPPSLPCGVSALVDDHTCPDGQIKRVTGSCAPTGAGPVTGLGIQRTCLNR